jgi:hypothetical protein
MLHNYSSNKAFYEIMYPEQGNAIEKLGIDVYPEEY